MKMKNSEEEKALQGFLLDIECLDELLPWTGKFNLFDVLKVSRTEIRHSNMLGWLLNPNENHGLGDSFLRGILQTLIENDVDEKYDVFQILLADLYSFFVYREWKNIDILLTSSEEKIVIAIENKVGSHEHSDQLNRYRKILETDFKDYKRMYVFLTPDGELPSDEENWDVITYTEVVELLERLMNQKELQPDILLMVKNYIEIIRRDIVEDQQLIEICNKIYNKHRKALDLIYENRIDGKTQIVEAIINTLAQLNEEGSIIYGKDWGNFSFRTQAMDEKLPLLKSSNSSWGTYSCYTYFLNIRDGKFCGILDLGGWNVPDEEMETLLKIIDILKPGDKRKRDFRYKRVFRTKWYDLNDVDDLEIQADELVRNAVKELKNIESMVIDKLNQM